MYPNPRKSVVEGSFFVGNGLSPSTTAGHSFEVHEHELENLGLALTSPRNAI